MFCMLLGSAIAAAGGALDATAAQIWKVRSRFQCEHNNSSEESAVVADVVVL